MEFKNCGIILQGMLNGEPKMFNTGDTDDLVILANSVEEDDLPLHLNTMAGITLEWGKKPKLWRALINKRLSLGGGLVGIIYERYDGKYTRSYNRSLRSSDYERLRVVSREESLDPHLIKD
jgi:hypothetical protein